MIILQAQPSIELSLPVKVGQEVLNMRCKTCGRKSDSTRCGWCDKIRADVMNDLALELGLKENVV